VVAALLVTIGPVLVGVARFVPDGDQTANPVSILFVSVMLLFGSVGEEIAMRGYPFQILVRRLGVWVALGITSVIFGLMHFSNADASVFSIVNTMGFGIVLGYAMIRSGDLWFPSGIHFGWNWVLPMVGTPLSGFRLNMSGYKLEWDVPALWSGGGYGPEAGLLACIAIALLLVFLRRAPVTPDQPLLLKAIPEETPPALPPESPAEV
jgi:membrane protease YdiL (CAAX protease family)